MQDEGVCQLLEWDSQFFGRRIGRLAPGRLAPDLMPAIFDWCGANRIAGLYFLADADHCETARLASQHGFSLMDVRVTLEHSRLHGDLRPAPAGEVVIRPFQRDDLPALRSMAGRLHQDSRFFFDPHFPPSRSRAMFEAWIEKSCRDERGAVFVAQFQGQPAGYIACRHADAQTGQIDLLGVDSPAQGRKAGRGLVSSALQWCAARGADRVLVVTQGRNVQAQRLYQRCGFTTASVQLWYHRWFEPSAIEGKA
jgi:dTDP-4-amino-4,6-dideoxy-D-galactose acyltransferase